MTIYKNSDKSYLCKHVWYPYTNPPNFCDRSNSAKSLMTRYIFTLNSYTSIGKFYGPSNSFINWFPLNWETKFIRRAIWDCIKCISRISLERGSVIETDVYFFRTLLIFLKFYSIGGLFWLAALLAILNSFGTSFVRNEKKKFSNIVLNKFQKNLLLFVCKKVFIRRCRELSVGRYLIGIRKKYFVTFVSKML